MNSYFFDTSAIIKIYHKEVGTPQVEKIYENLKNKIFISQLTKLEFISTLYKKYRTHEINQKALGTAKNIFLQDCEKRFTLVGSFVSHHLKDSSMEIIESYGMKMGIRTLDALQLAAFKQISENNCYFVCADKTLNKIAEDIGINIFFKLK
ncbi:type II toxin-antitoxin system VapC family toxin [Natranaerofaba carboxydovora]|uniref:type II toxin-antitoxin system VapC family toxin n=1 Tax=Natranaerofaba carboxydovora TaxID=2742683 RepID=UPI001F12CE1A|nr:type II toxin-antitoxin system VapC family toxin [Natranaerofaba carboxydovora]UMZ74420.1 PIN domain protein [Natranaerofaba carboxydovora]